MSAEKYVEIDLSSGAHNLRALTATWEDVQKARLAAEQRGLLPLAAELQKTEDKLGRQIKKAVAAHPLADWLPRGLGGVHVARLLALIDDPWRFPGRLCTRGHYLSTADLTSESDKGFGGACPVETHDGPCDGTLLPPRPGTGTKSLWHYCGLHAVDGRSPRRQKGKVVDWNPDARTIVLMPGGIAEQIVRLRVEKYRDIYDQQKERLIRERGAAGVVASERAHGPAFSDGPEADELLANDSRPGLRPIEIEGRARKIAAKAFIGDLLSEWKRRTDASLASDVCRGAPRADVRGESDVLRGPVVEAAA